MMMKDEGDDDDVDYKRDGLKAVSLGAGEGPRILKGRCYLSTQTFAHLV